MRTVPVLARATLARRAMFARGHHDGWAVVASGGEITLLDAELRVVASVAGGRRLVDVTVVGPDRVVTADDVSLAACDVATGARRWEVAGAFVACRLAPPGLWAAELRDDRVVVTLRDITTGAVVRETSVPDPFGGATAMLLPHPDPAAVVVWVAAGQDGQAGFVVIDDGRFLVTSEVGPRDRLPPVFAPAGDCFLSAGAGALELRTWPSDQVLDQLPWSDDEAPDDPDGDDLVYLPGGYAAWASAAGRLYVVDLHELVVVDEVAIQDHPAVAAGEPAATALSFLEPGPAGRVLTVHGPTALAVTALAAWSPDAER